MSYQPPSDQPTLEGGTPTTNVSAGPGGAYTQPTGDYTPPPGSAYTPPPGGGYSAPPPPPPPTGMGGGGGGMGSMGGGGSFNFQGLIQSWMGAVTRPSTAFYEGEIPKANWMSVLVGLTAVVVVRILISIITAPAAAERARESAAQLQQAFGGSSFDTSAFTGGSTSVAGSFWTIIWTPLLFFIGAGILFLTAKMFGGQGGNFLTHCYLLSLSWVPTRLLGAVLGIGSALSSGLSLIVLLLLLLVYLYQLYSVGKALEASQRMVPGRAQLAAFLPTIGLLVLLCLCVIAGLVLGLSFLGSLVNR